MKWMLVLLYIGGYGHPVISEFQTFETQKACHEAATALMKKHEKITAVCDERKQSK